MEHLQTIQHPLAVFCSFYEVCSNGVLLHVYRCKNFEN